MFWRSNARGTPDRTEAETTIRIDGKQWVTAPRMGLVGLMKSASVAETLEIPVARRAMSEQRRAWVGLRAPAVAARVARPMGCARAGVAADQCGVLV
jgi:hypothetical protein